MGTQRGNRAMVRVALVGYTVGKSTLMNAIVFVENKLFTLWTPQLESS
jgi:50S ribosomal subunit-associated GTPase HflX